MFQVPVKVQREGTRIVKDQNLALILNCFIEDQILFMARNAGSVPAAFGIWEEARSLRDWFRGPSLPGFPSVCKVSLGNSLWPHRPSDAPDKIREAGIVTAI